MSAHTTRSTQSDQFRDQYLFDETYVALAAASKQLRTIATWALRERSLDEAKAVWQLRPDLDAPQSVLAAWDEFLATKLSDLAEEDLLHEDVGKLAEDLLSSFENGQREVLLTRVLAPKPLTLAEIGSTLGVSRARVGQIHKQVEERLGALLNHRRFLPLKWRAGDLAKVLGAAAPLCAEQPHQALLRAARDCPDELADTLGRLVLHLAGPYSRHSELDVAPRTRTQVFLLADGRHDFERFRDPQLGGTPNRRVPARLAGASLPEHIGHIEHLATPKSHRPTSKHARQTQRFAITTRLREQATVSALRSYQPPSCCYPLWARPHPRPRPADEAASPHEW